MNTANETAIACAHCLEPYRVVKGVVQRWCQNEDCSQRYVLKP